MLHSLVVPQVRARITYIMHRLLVVCHPLLLGRCCAALRRISHVRRIDVFSSADYAIPHTKLSLQPEASVMGLACMSRMYGFRLNAPIGFAENMPLHAAVIGAPTPDAKPLAVAWLINNGAPLDAANGLGHTPLMLAAMRHQPRMADLLLAAGGNMFATDPYHGRTALICAVINGDAAVLDVMLHHAEHAGVVARLLAVKDSHGKVAEDYVDLQSAHGRGMDTQMSVARVAESLKRAVTVGMVMHSCRLRVAPEEPVEPDEGGPAFVWEGGSWRWQECIGVK